MHVKIFQRLKRLIIIGALLYSPLTAAADLEQEDKQKHMQASAGIAMASYAAFRTAKMNKFTSASLSFVITMAVGHMKETSDPFYDDEDMQANAAGASVGLMLPLSFTF